MNISPASSNILKSSIHDMATAADLIKAGKLVILPTETVYGIALNLLSPEARAAAKLIKQVPEGQLGSPWVLHVANLEELFSWAKTLSPMAHRLITKAVPGPISFQIKLAPADLAAARTRLADAADETLQDGYLTLRCPDFSTTQKVLALATTPKSAIAIIGAGTPAQPAIFDVSDLPESRLPQNPIATPISAVLDGGATRYRKPSTVVRIVADSFSVIRPGVIDERIIQKMADLQILFICSGNTCRSPMAAALAAKLLADRLHIPPSELPLRHIVVQSAGLHATKGLRAAREAVDAVTSMKADLSNHISQPATIDLLRRADLIYTMTDAHREEILDQIPTAENKTYRLDPQEDVEDPIGAGLPVYKEVANRLVELLKHRLSELPL